MTKNDDPFVFGVRIMCCFFGAALIAMLVGCLIGPPDKYLAAAKLCLLYERNEAKDPDSLTLISYERVHDSDSFVRIRFKGTNSYGAFVTDYKTCYVEDGANESDFAHDKGWYILTQQHRELFPDKAE